MKRSVGWLILMWIINWPVFSQNVINGYAPQFVGQKVELYTYQDYVTLNRVKLGEGEVSPTDSMFRITYNTNATIKGIIQIDRTESSLYLVPGKNYTVYFPKSKEAAGVSNALTNLYFSDLDTTDLNYRILQYHQWFDMYIAYHEKEVQRGGFIACLDTFQTYVSEAYKEVKDPFFITYVRYDLAEMQQTNGGNASSEKRLQTFLNFIEPFPLYYENDRYMQFFLAFYDKEFREYLPATEEKIMKAIYQKSPTLLMLALKGDIFLANPEIRELVMVDKLGKAFYREVEFRPNILTILDSVAHHSDYPYNAVVAKNVKAYITNLEPGYPAPAVQLKKPGQPEKGWTNYKGKFIYFNLFATWNEASVNDMEIIARMVPKYSEDIAFVSVCTDKDTATFNAFLKAHPAYTWDIFYVGEDEDLMGSFNITSVPNYYLFDQEGFIYQAPALSPAPNGKYQSIEGTLMNIQRALHPELPPRVGQ